MRFIAFDEARSFSAAPEEDSKTAKAVQNLLVHIPGEASGFYLMAIPLAKDAKDQVTIWMAVLIGLIALGLLILLRWLGGATLAVKITSIIAFFIWMLAIDQGFLNLLLVDAGVSQAQTVGVILALAYSAVITALASFGKLK